MTLRQAKDLLKPLGITVTKRDAEYRVRYAGDQNEDHTYYTNDLQDALETGRAMSREIKR